MFGKCGLVAIPQTHCCLLKSCSELHSPPAVILDALMAKGPGLALNIKMSDGGDICFPVCFPQLRCVKFPGERCGHRPAFPLNSLGEKSGLGTRCLWPAVSQGHFPADVPLRGAAVALPIPGTQLHGSGLLAGPPSYFGLGPRAAHTADITGCALPLRWEPDHDPRMYWLWKPEHWAKDGKRKKRWGRKASSSGNSGRQHWGFSSSYMFA